MIAVRRIRKLPKGPRIRIGRVKLQPRSDQIRVGRIQLGGVVRVDLHLKQADGTVLATAALLNGGFEAEQPHVLLPRRAFEHLFENPPAQMSTDQVQTAGGASQVNVLTETVRAWVGCG